MLRTGHRAQRTMLQARELGTITAPLSASLVVVVICWIAIVIAHLMTRLWVDNLVQKSVLNLLACVDVGWISLWNVVIGSHQTVPRTLDLATFSLYGHLPSI